MAQLGDNASAEIRDRGAKLQSSYKCQVIMDIWDSYNRMMMIQTLGFMTLDIILTSGGVNKVEGLVRSLMA